MGTNKKSAGPCIKNNTYVNQSNAKMNEYIYISRSRSRSSNVQIQNAEKWDFACYGTLFYMRDHKNTTNLWILKNRTLNKANTQKHLNIKSEGQAHVQGHQIKNLKFRKTGIFECIYNNIWMDK